MKKLIAFFAALAVAGCAGTDGFDDDAAASVPTPTVDYVQHLDPYGGDHKDMFLSRLTMNYRSFAIYNAQVSRRPEIGEMFAQKAVSAFAGETPMPESLDHWKINDKDELFELRNACQDLLGALQEDASVEKPKLAAEAQAKFDCWIASVSSGQHETAAECRRRFQHAMLAIKGNGGIIDEDKILESVAEPKPTSGFDDKNDYPTTAELEMFTSTMRTREGVVIVNNINVPADLIRPTPPVVFNQNIYGNGAVAGGSGENGERPLGNEMVSRDEFINMMMSLRDEIQEINKRLASMPEKEGDSVQIKTILIPTPAEKQTIMEEVFEVKFDFNKANVKPEFEPAIQNLAAIAKGNKNVKISVIGHTDTVGSSDYNFALGGRRAENIKQMLIKHGIPASSIIILSSGKNDLKVPTGKNVKNADNRRVRVVREVRHTERPQMPDPVAETGGEK